MLSEPHNIQFEIDAVAFEELINSGNIDVIDVREPGEDPVIEYFSSLHIPLNQLQSNLQLLQSTTLVTICQSGKRSLQAARQLAAAFGSSKKIYSLRGGIIQWKQVYEKQLS